MENPEQETPCAREFYDTFLRSRMIGYRLHKNPRIENIKRRVATLVRPGQRILEIGCGIGIVSECMARKAIDITVFACDLSAENIVYAKQTVSCPNIAWKVVDVTKDLDEVFKWINGPVDLIVLADVLEHIQSRQHLEFFTELGQILRPAGKILLTLPSPQYQRFLTTHHPEELQPVDEILELSDLIALALHAGCVIKHYTLEDTGGTRNQYVHCVLDSATGAEVLPSARRGLPASALIRIAGFVDHHFFLPFRKRKYVDRVLTSAHTVIINPARLSSNTRAFRLYPDLNSSRYWSDTATRHKLEEAIQVYEGDILGKTVLDFGGGAAPFRPLFERICKRFFETAVPDLRSDKIAVEPDAAEEEFDSTVDVILSYQVIQHLSDPRTHLQEIWKRLSDNGLLILCTCRAWSLEPNTDDSSPWSTLDLCNFLNTIGFATLSTSGVMSPGSSLIQGWQDSVANMIPSPLKPGFFRLMQKLVAFIDRRTSSASTNLRAQELIFVARKHPL